MCGLCDNPNLTEQDYLEILRQSIDHCGWAIQGVEGDRHHPPLAYTVGLTELGLPEFVVTGTQLCCAAQLLDTMAAISARRGEVPEPGAQLPTRDGRRLEIVALTEPSAHLRFAVDMYGTTVRALQLVHTDGHGRWPWDRRYSRADGIQPVLGMRAL